MDDSQDFRMCPQCGTSCPLEHHYCPACGFPVGTLSSSREDKFVGKTLPGGYHILDLISVGGMGRVYRAEQSVLGRTVAVKIIHPHLLSDENSAVRFMNEARAASQLNHPNSVSVFDFGRTTDGQPYLVMEFLRGKDLARTAYEEGPISLPRIVDVLRQVLAALGEAHELGIVHRDLKPENVILEPLRRGGDFVKVVDFGLAKLKADAHAPNVTSPGIVCGTPDYMAPEQGRGDAIDGRSDLYAVGVILFQLLTGQLPFEADNPTQVVLMHMTLPVPDPRLLAPERQIPEGLLQVMYRALEKDPSRRYQDAQEFSEGLGQALQSSGELQRTTRPSAPPPAPLPSVMKCPACGQMVPLSKFCGECGSRLPVRPSLPSAKTPVQLPLPLVGREEDLEFLEDRLRAAQERVLGARIVGELGSGKTRLLKELAARADLMGTQVIVAGPDPFYADVAYHALQRVMGQLVKLRNGDPANVNDAQARRGFEEIFSMVPHGERRSAEERRLAAARALRWALEKAHESPGSERILVLIDDLHRVDCASRRAFADVMGEPPECGALFVAAHTPGFEAGWGGQRAVARVLEGLPRQIAARLFAASVSTERAAAIEDVTGNGFLPLHIDQLVRHSLEGGGDAPDRLGDLIALRVDTLEPSARRVLQALVVLGDEIEKKLLEPLLPRGFDIERSLQLLQGAGMIGRENGAQGEDVLSTTHPLLRDIVFAGTPAEVRRELHERALTVLEKNSAPTEACALHAFYAQDSFQALLLLEQVADRAAQRADLDAEVLALRRGLEIGRQEISRGELDDPLRAVLIFSRKLGESLARGGNFADAEGVLREALDIAGPAGPDRAKVLGALAHVAYGRKRSREALGYIDQAIEAARHSGARDLVSALTDTRRAWAS